MRPSFWLLLGLLACGLPGAWIQAQEAVKSPCQELKYPVDADELTAFRQCLAQEKKKQIEKRRKELAQRSVEGVQRYLEQNKPTACDPKKQQCPPAAPKK